MLAREVTDSLGRNCRDLLGTVPAAVRATAIHQSFPFLVQPQSEPWGTGICRDPASVVKTTLGTAQRDIGGASAAAVGKGRLLTAMLR